MKICLTLLSIRDDNGQDIFIHKSGIQDVKGAKYGLDDSEVVEFEVYQGEKTILSNFHLNIF